MIYDFAEDMNGAFLQEGDFVVFDGNRIGKIFSCEDQFAIGVWSVNIEPLGKSYRTTRASIHTRKLTNEEITLRLFESDLK